MAAYQNDLRTRVLADWDVGMKANEVAAKYRVSRAWVHRLVQRRPARHHGQALSRQHDRRTETRSCRERILSTKPRL